MSSPIDPGAGGRAKRPTDDDPRFRPDWSSVGKNRMTSTLPRSYFNYCPGDTKLAKKWKHHWYRTDFRAWKAPAEQLQTYCGDRWNVRYGYIITEEELAVFLVTRIAIDPGLAASKASRVKDPPSTQAHARVASGDTDLSSLAAPMSTTTQSYSEDHPNVDYQAIKVKSIPWHETRKGHLNVKKALFLLLMLAGALGGPKFVQTDYPPFDSWWHEKEMFRHNSTGRVKKRLQTNDVLCQPSGRSPQLTDAETQTSSSGHTVTATQE